MKRRNAIRDAMPELPQNPVEFDAAVAKYVRAESLLSAGDFAAALKVLQESGGLLFQLINSPGTTHTPHFRGWRVACAQLEFECREALGESDAGNDFRCLEQSLTWRSPDGVAHSPNEFAQLFETGCEKFRLGSTAWKAGAEPANVLVHLEEAKACFVRLKELAPESSQYGQMVKACCEAIRFVSLAARPEKRRLLRRFLRRQPGLTTNILRQVSNAGAANYSDEQRQSSGNSPETENGAAAFRTMLLNAVWTFLPLIGIHWLLLKLAAMNALLAVAAFSFGPIVLALVTTSSSMWKSDKMRDRLSSGCVSAFLMCWLGLCLHQLEPMLSLAAGAGYLVSFLAASVYLFRFGVAIKSRSIHRIAAELARLNRQAEERSCEWALWIYQTFPRELALLFVELQKGDSRCSDDSSPRMRLWVEWTCYGTVYVEEVTALVVTILALSLDELVEPPRPVLPPRRRDLKNLCTSWAVLLRCPLHLARGDDVAVCS